jgi:hypothetical protein
MLIGQEISSRNYRLLGEVLMTILTRGLAVCALCSSVAFGQTMPLPLPLKVTPVPNEAAQQEAIKAAEAGVQQAQAEVDRMTGAASRGVAATPAALEKANANLQSAKDNAEKVKAQANKTSSSGCWILPSLPHCVDATQAALQAANNMAVAAGTAKAVMIGYDDAVNAILGTSGKFTPFNQIQSIYNGSSGSATISSDLGTLNFDSGLQLALVTNAQAGSAGAGSTSTSTGGVPTLAANGAGQAVQNVLYGGTFLLNALVPVILAQRGDPSNQDAIILNVDWVNRGGVDIQNFKSGTNVNSTNPPVHVSSKLDAYFQYNSTHQSTDPSGFNFTGAVFVGGSYGYDYMSHGYASDYGFGNRVNNGIGQASIGVMINNVVKVAFSRAFGPSQTYVDSTSMKQTTVNNFKSWSIGISYQQAAAQPGTK